MSELCQGCDKREFCSSLCSEAELYVSKDFVPLKEGNYGLIPPMEPFRGANGNERREIKWSKMEAKIVLLLSEGKKYFQIAKLLKITPEYLEKIVYRIRKKTS